jgi:catechol 2,3-dioxygenase-like lactoylglutathione lyase family enzyme
MLTALDHAVIVVHDLEAATATYERLYGRRASWRGVHPGWGSANTLFRLSNCYTELIAPVGEGALGDALRAHLAAHGEGPYALAFATADAAAAASTLGARGNVAGEPREGNGRDASTGAERRWRTLFLPTGDTRGVQVIVIEHLSPASVLPPAPIDRDAAAVIDGVDHVVVMTADAEAVIALYRDRLGIRLAFDRTFEQRGLRLLFFRIAGITVELAAPLGAAATPDRFWGISYRVRDVEAARARLHAGGFDVSEVRTGHKEGTRVCTVRGETHGVATLLIGTTDHADS